VQDNLEPTRRQVLGMRDPLVGSLPEIIIPLNLETNSDHKLTKIKRKEKGVQKISANRKKIGIVVLLSSNVISFYYITPSYHMANSLSLSLPLMDKS
jgi:hypothetical protein